MRGEPETEYGVGNDGTAVYFVDEFFVRKAFLDAGDVGFGAEVKTVSDFLVPEAGMDAGADCLEEIHLVG